MLNVELVELQRHSTVGEVGTNDGNDEGWAVVGEEGVNAGVEGVVKGGAKIEAEDCLETLVGRVDSLRWMVKCVNG